MALTCKHILAVILLLQVAVLLVYLTTKDFSFTAFVFNYNSNISLQDVANTSLQDVVNTSLQDVANTSLQDVVNTSLQDVATTQGPPPRTPETFQQIDHTQAWLYSAFYDHVAAQQGKPLVRVFGVVEREWCKKVFCTFSTETGSLASTGANIALPGAHNMKYLPSYLECSVPSNVRPTHVSVSFETTNKTTNRLQVLYPGPRIRNFTVCYSVLHSGFNMTNQLIESIEFNRLLGAEHFMVYNYSISPEVGQILRRYQDDGLVTVLHWPVPTLESHYYAQMTALNDCSYRNRNISRFVVVLDTDEFIVPRYHYTFMQLIYNVSPQEIDVSQFMNSSEPSNKRQTQTGCFIVRSSFFIINSKPVWDMLPSQFSLGTEEKKNIIKYKILTLSQVVRHTVIFPHRERSKYIARPEHVYISGVHEVHQFVSSISCNLISENTALVHHYRALEPQVKSVNDTSMLKFQQTLYPRVIKQMQRFPNLFP